MASAPVGAARAEPAPLPAADRRPSTGTPARPRRAGRLTPYLFLAPYLILFGLFAILPIVLGSWMSLHRWDFQLDNKPFVGLDNYRDLIDSESLVYDRWWESVRATLIFTVLSVPLLLVLPLGMALLLDRRFPGRTFFRAVFFGPYVLGVVVISLLWRFLLDTNLGMVNHVLGAIGLPADTPWLTGLPWAFISMVGVTVWWTAGFNAVIYLAGLQDIPPELHEAAKIDGASAWERFRYVTLPGLRPVLLFVLTTTIIASANVFGQSFLITQGAPGTMTRSVVWYIVDEGIYNNDAGRAAAMSIVFTLLLAAVSAANFRLFRYRDD